VDEGVVVFVFAFMDDRVDDCVFISMDSELVAFLVLLLKCELEFSVLHDSRKGNKLVLSLLRESMEMPNFHSS